MTATQQLSEAGLKALAVFLIEAHLSMEGASDACQETAQGEVSELLEQGEMARGVSRVLHAGKATNRGGRSNRRKSGESGILDVPAKGTAKRQGR